jgi:hypothetical protein
MSALSTTTSTECATFLEVLRKCGFNASVRDGGLRVGPRERIGEFEKWAIQAHKVGLIELLQAEVAGVQA